MQTVQTSTGALCAKAASKCLASRIYYRLLSRIIGSVTEWSVPLKWWVVTLWSIDGGEEAGRWRRVNTQ